MGDFEKKIVFDFELWTWNLGGLLFLRNYKWLHCFIFIFYFVIAEQIIPLKTNLCLIFRVWKYVLVSLAFLTNFVKLNL